jgi:hypothetical protein
MLQKVLGWSTLGLTLLFVVLSLAVMFAGGALGPAMLNLMAPIAVALLAVAILLAASMLVISLFQ